MSLTINSIVYHIKIQSQVSEHLGQIKGLHFTGEIYLKLCLVQQKAQY